MAIHRQSVLPHAWLLAGVVYALLSFGALEGLRILHYQSEEGCPAQCSGEAVECFLCSHFSYLSGEIAAVEIPTAPCNARLLVVADAAVETVVQPLLVAPSRAPPVTV